MAIKKIMKLPFPFNLFVFCLTASTIIQTVNANPQGEIIRGGTAVVSRPNSNEVRIDQSSQNAVIDWKSFNINNNETTSFYQPAGGITLNRVTTASSSQIYGKLTATGRIILVNGGGIAFGPNAEINVGGLIASTTDITNENFMAGNYIFDIPTKSNSAKITNAGLIKAAENGLVALVGPNISNTGNIQATLGQVILATGNKFTFDFFGDQLINFAVTEAIPKDGKIKNSGSIVANGGKILITAQTASQVMDSLIDMDGVIQANSIAQKNGEILLMAEGGVRVTGQILAEGQAAGTHGGNITLSAKNFDLKSGAKISVNGAAGGGNVVLGYTNSNGVVVGNSDALATQQFSTITANAFSNSANAGTVAIYADRMELHGDILAIANGNYGMGGTIQLFGDRFDVKPNASMDTSGKLFGGSIQIGGNPFNTNGKLTSSFINIDPLTNLVSKGLGNSSLGGNVNLNADFLKIAGTLDVSAKNSGGFGGVIQAQGDEVQIMPLGFLNASGNAGGGSVVLGTNPIFQIPTSKLITVHSTSKIDVSADGDNSFGGLVSIFGDDVIFSGSINASSIKNMSNSFGGTIKIIANNSVLLRTSAYLDARGDIGGGMITIGGAPFGLDPIAKFVDVEKNATLNASAVRQGDGGLVTVYSNNITNFFGNIFAKGGDQGGNGGFVQIAGLQLTNFDGKVDVSAPQGATGTVLIGP